MTRAERLKRGRERMAKMHARRRAEGLCILCGKRPPATRTGCRTCLLKNRRERRKRLGLKPWRPGGPGRPPMVQ